MCYKTSPLDSFFTIGEELPVYALSSLALLTSSIALFLYQILWFRLLGFHDNENTATVLMAFFLGLILGSLLTQVTQSCLRKNFHDLKIFVFMQIVVAISAVLLLPILIEPEYITALSSSHQIASWSGFFTAFLITLIPALGLGMAFPLLTTWFSEQTPSHTHASLLPSSYALFMLGGVIATLLGGFYSLPQFGLTGGLYTAAGFNLIAALFGYLAYIKTRFTITNNKKSPPPTTETTSHFSSLPASLSWQRIRLLIILACLSVIWLGSEIIWSRIISLYAGSTLYSFSVILASSLAGMAIGAFLLSRWQQTKSLNQTHLFKLLIALFIAFNITRLLFSYAPQIYNDSPYLGELFFHLDALWFLLMVCLPSLLFGASIALTLSLYCQTNQYIKKSIKQSIGFAYALHLLASIAGAIVVVLWLIPSIGSANILLIFAITPLLLALLLIPLNTSNKRKMSGRLTSYALLITLGAGAFFIPPLSFQAMFQEHYYQYINKEKPVINLRTFERPEGIISLTLYQREALNIQINGLTQSEVHVRSPYRGNINESLTAVLPYLLQKNATEALVLGFRAGTIPRVLANSDLEGVVTTIEPEPKVVESMMVLNLLVNFPFLDDGRVDIEYKSFREALKNNDEHYSIITAQAPYAWLTGATQMYSQEFFTLVHSRLKPDGIFGYHLNLLRLNTQALQAILHTFYSVFPKGAIFGDPTMGALVLLGSNQPLVMDFERTKTYFEQEVEAMKTLRYGDLRNATELPRYFLFTNNIAKQTSSTDKINLITDSNLLIETLVTLSANLPSGKEDPYTLINQYIQESQDN